MGSIKEYYFKGFNKINLEEVANFKAGGVYIIKIISGNSTITKHIIKL